MMVINDQELLSVLLARIETPGEAAKIAREANVQKSRLSEYRHAKRPINERVAAVLGYQRAWVRIELEQP